MSDFFANATLELWGARTNNCRRAAIALEEAGLPYAVRRIDMRHGEHKSAEFLSHNPIGQVPLLVMRQSNAASFVLTQSNAIMMYAAERSSDLLPAFQTQERTRAYERLFYFLGDVIGPSHYSVFLRVRGENSGSEMLVRQAVAMLVDAERFLAESEFIGGDRFSLADIAALTFAMEASQFVEPTTVPKLHAWLGRVSQRPAVQRGHHAFD